MLWVLFLAAIVQGQELATGYGGYGSVVKSMDGQGQSGHAQKLIALPPTFTNMTVGRGLLKQGEETTPRLMCTAMCEGQGRVFNTIIGNECWCGCRLYACPVVINGQPQSPCASAPCCARDACAAACGCNGGFCDRAGNCVCNCQPCDPYTPLACTNADNTPGDCTFP